MMGTLIAFHHRCYTCMGWISLFNSHAAHLIVLPMVVSGVTTHCPLTCDNVASALGLGSGLQLTFFRSIYQLQMTACSVKMGNKHFNHVLEDGLLAKDVVISPNK